MLQNYQATTETVVDNIKIDVKTKYNLCNIMLEGIDIISKKNMEEIEEALHSINSESIGGIYSILKNHLIYCKVEKIEINEKNLDRLINESIANFKSFENMLEVLYE